MKSTRWASRWREGNSHSQGVISSTQRIISHKCSQCQITCEHRGLTRQNCGSLGILKSSPIICTASYPPKHVLTRHPKVMREGRPKQRYLWRRSSKKGVVAGRLKSLRGHQGPTALREEQRTVKKVVLPAQVSRLIEKGRENGCKPRYGKSQGTISFILVTRW